MKIAIAKDFEKREKGDLLVIPCWEGPALAVSHSIPAASHLLSSGDFKGKGGEISFLYPTEGMEPRILMLGLGEKDAVSAESLRRAMASAMKAAQAKRAKTIHIAVPKFPKSFMNEAVESIVEGALLTNYSFNELKGDTRKASPVLCEHLHLSGVDPSLKKSLDRLIAIAEAVYFVRDLVNGNADEVNPERLAKVALSMSKKVKTTVLDHNKLSSEGMGLLLAVGRGAVEAPRLICSSYRGNPKSDQHIVLVGKGVTFDTGGLSLKTTENMLTMKCDMAGAATVLAVVKLAAELDLKVNVTALAPAAENAIGSRSYKLGDVYKACNGKSVEILNTDAEGRLILADAIAYAVKHYKPTFIVDIGTLTGAILIALGDELAGLFTNDERIAKNMEAASANTGEIIWRLPLHDYKESLKSEIADIANLGGRDAGSMKCALFLQEFTGGVPWAHIDMAGVAYLNKSKHYHPARATGWGVRLLLHFLERSV